LELKKLENIFNNQLGNDEKIVFKNLLIQFIMIKEVKLIDAWILNFL